MKRLLSLLDGFRDAPAARRTRSEPSDLLFDCLPPLLVREAVVPFLAAPPDLLTLRELGFSLRDFKWALLALRQVSRQWLAVVSDLETDAQSKVCCFVFRVGGGGEFHREQRRAARKATLEHLQIVTGVAVDDWDDGFILSNYRSLHATALAQQPWGNVFPELPKLSSTLCPNIQALILPFDQHVDDGVLLSLITPVTAALERWFLSSGGLKMLTIPWIPDEEQGQFSDLVAAVAAFCPQIEQFRGWHVDSKNGYFDSTQQVHESVWADFCNTSTRLQAFEWCLRTLSKQSISQFSAKTRPHLLNLSIQDQGAQFDTDVNTLEVLKPVLAATPNLQTFEFSRSECRDNAWADREGLPVDQFCKYVALQCRFLETFQFCTLPQLCPSLIMTERGVVELVSLPFIRSLSLESVQLESNGLVEVLEAAGSGVGKCALEINIFTSCTGHLQMMRLLEDLRDQNPVHRKVQLHVKQTYSRGVNRELENQLRTAESTLQLLLDQLNQRSKELLMALKVKASKHGDVFQVRELELWLNHAETDATGDKTKYETKLVMLERGSRRVGGVAKREVRRADGRSVERRWE